MRRRSGSDGGQATGQSVRRVAVIAVIGTMWITTVPAVGSDTDSRVAVTDATKADSPVWQVGRVGNADVMFDSRTGRVYTLTAPGGDPATSRDTSVASPSAQPSPGEGSPADDPEPANTHGRNANDDAQTVDGWDSRLAGRRRSLFYPSRSSWGGPGRIDTIAGGTCDGRGPLEVAVDPGTVRVDGAGRVFWLDQNWNAHQKAAAYVRVLENGRVRTLGTIVGPVEGRVFRDAASSTGLSRIEPDGHGGVYYTYLGHWTSNAWNLHAPYDDTPINSVVGHIDRHGRARYVAGIPGMFFATNGTSTVTGNQYPGVVRHDSEAGVDRSFYTDEERSPNDGGPVANTRFREVTAIAAFNGGLLVADGDRPGMASAATSARDSRAHQSVEGGQRHYDSANTTIRFLNISRRDVTFYKGTHFELVVRAGTVATIAGNGEPPNRYQRAGTPPTYGRFLEPRNVGFSFVSAIDAGPDGIVRIMMIDEWEGNPRLLTLNPTGSPRSAHGITVPPGMLAVASGWRRGYAGDGASGEAVSFDFRNQNGWYGGDLTVADDGSAYIADTLNHRVRRVAPDGIVSTVVGTGTPGRARDGDAATAAPLNFPMGVALRHGRLLVSDWGNARIVAVDGKGSGRLRAAVGTGSPMLCGDGGQAAGPSPMGGAGLGSPHDAVSDSKGNIYIADIVSGTVRRIGPDGTIRTVVGKPLHCPSGHPSFTSLPFCPPPTASGDGGRADQAVLRAPGYLLVDRYDNLYISDGGRVRYVNFRSYPLVVHGRRVEPGTIQTLLQTDELVDRVLYEVSGPLQSDVIRITYYTVIGFGGLALDDAGTLYVADIVGNQVFALDWCGIRVPVAGTGKPVTNSADEPNGDGGPAAAATVSPTDVAWDRGTNMLYIASAREARVRVVNLGDVERVAHGVHVLAGFIATVAGGAPCNTFNATGGPALFRRNTCMYGDGAPARAAALRAPFGVDVRPGGRLFVADALGNVVRVVEPGGTIGTLAGTTPTLDDGANWWQASWWIGGVCGDGGRAYDACLSGAVSANLTRSGDLLIAEQLSGRVRRVTSALRAPLRPRARTVPLRGAGWRFTPSRLLDTGNSATHVRTPTVAVDTNGHAYVTAGETDRSENAVGCPTWRVDIDSDGHGRDRAWFLGRPDATPVADTTLRTLNTAGYECSLAVAPRPPGAGPTDGVLAQEDRVSLIAVRRPGTGLFRVGTTTHAATSVDAGKTFLGVSPGLLSTSGTGLTRQAYITATGPDSAVMAFNSSGTIGTGTTGVGFARGVAGAAYAHASDIAFQGGPHALHGFTPTSEALPMGDLPTGRPIVVDDDRIYVPLHVALHTWRPDRSLQRSDDVFTLARSVDGGVSWDRSAPVFTEPCVVGTAPNTSRWVYDPWCMGWHGKPQATADRAGNLYAVWDVNGAMWFRASTDGGRSWLPAVRVDSGLNLATYPAIVAGADGRVAIAFLGTTSKANSLRTMDAEWSVYLAITENGTSKAPRWTQSLVSEQPVHVGQICQGDNVMCPGADVLSPMRRLGTEFSVAMRPDDGRVVIAYPVSTGIEVGGARRQGYSVAVTRQCSGPSLLGGARPVSPCGRPAESVVPDVPVACAPHASDPGGDAGWRGDQRLDMDLRSVGFGTAEDQLVVRIGVGAAPTALPPPATGKRWIGTWYRNGQGYWVAAVTPTMQGAGGLSYRWGTIGPDGALAFGGYADGDVVGNVIEVRVPRATVGVEKRGDLLYDLAARTELLTGSVPDAHDTAATGTWERVDSAAASVGYRTEMKCGRTSSDRKHAGPPGAPVANTGSRPTATGPSAGAAPLVPCNERPPARQPEPEPEPEPRPTPPTPGERPQPAPRFVVPVAPPPPPPPAPIPNAAPNAHPQFNQQVQQQPGQQTQNQPAEQVQPLTGIAADEQEQHATAEEYAMSRLEVPPVLPAALAMAIAAGALAWRDRRRQQLAHQPARCGRTGR